MNRILYVEDNEADVWLLQRELSKECIVNPLDVCEDVPSAVTYLSSNPPPLIVILDLTLRGHTGLDVLGYMRQQERLAHVPVVVLTVSKNEEDEIRSYQFGAQAFEKKPLNFQSLINATRELLSLGWELVRLEE